MVLHLSHHKSYHVYNAENIARVRRDEENARKEATDLATLAKQRDSEARVDLLRKRAKSKRSSEAENALERQLKSKGKNDEPEVAQSSRAVIVPAPEPEKLYETNGHVNFWPELEQDNNNLVKSRRGNPENEAEKKKEDEKWDEMTTMYLGKPAKELKPWYASADLISGEERKKTEDQRLELRYKDNELKNMHDPLQVMNSYLQRREDIQKNLNNMDTPRFESSTPVPSLLRRKRRKISPDRSTHKDIKDNRIYDGEKEDEELDRKVRKRERRKEKRRSHEDKGKKAEESSDESKKDEYKRVTAAAAREASERDRARALIESRKKEKKKLTYNSTPSPNGHGWEEDRFNIRWTDDMDNRRRRRR